MSVIANATFSKKTFSLAFMEKKKNSWSATFEAFYCMVLKLWNFGKSIRNTWKVLKYDSGEGWIACAKWRSVA
jgi:hypothetical protein